MTAKDIKPEKREFTRLYMNNYPATIRKTDGGSIKTVIGNLSMKGMQIKCNRISAYLLTGRRIGFLDKMNIPEVGLQAVFPFKKGIKKINVTCKIIYSAMADETNPTYTFLLGLKIIRHEGRSMDILKEILQEGKIPVIRSGTLSKKG